MRPLTATLLKAQRSASRQPLVHVTASNRLTGVINLKWERLYSGSEPDGPHALTLAGDGSLIRLRITPAEDNRQLYWQRVAAPGPDSDFSHWTTLNHYGVINCAACSFGPEVSLFWIKSNGEIDYLRSLDSGLTWHSLEYPGYAAAGDVSGLAAAYRPNGDLALFFTDSNTLYVIHRLNAEWQDRISWERSTGVLTGVAALYDGDWKLLVCGKDSAACPGVWSLVYGDGGEVAPGLWSDLKEIASAPDGSAFDFSSVYLDKPNVYRCFYVETFNGNVPYSRAFSSHTLPATSFLENRWREPVPFQTESPSGLALAHDPDYLWLEIPAGIWRASLAEISLDLSSDVISVKQEQTPDSGRILIELNNSRGQYSLGNPSISSSVLQTGCEITFSPGCRTSIGNEFSTGQCFILQACEHHTSPGKNSLFLSASDGWRFLENWTARFQFRWNKPDAFGAPTHEATVKEILTQVLARAGIKLEVASQSMMITGFFPDFTLHPGDSGRSAVNRLLSFVPDLLFIEGNSAFLVNPTAGNPLTYDYGSGHLILEGSYLTSLWKTNRVRIEGKAFNDEAFAWPEIQKQGDLLENVEDLNISGNPDAAWRANTYLRKVEINAAGGFIRVPVNCGQQLLDVISITDPASGLLAARRRVLGLSLSWLPSKAVYEQKLILGGV